MFERYVAALLHTESFLTGLFHWNL